LGEQHPPISPAPTTRSFGLAEEAGDCERLPDTEDDFTLVVESSNKEAEELDASESSNNTSSSVLLWLCWRGEHAQDPPLIHRQGFKSGLTGQKKPFRHELVSRAGIPRKETYRDTGLHAFARRAAWMCPKRDRPLPWSRRIAHAHPSPS
jgi:hypothetical protein